MLDKSQLYINKMNHPLKAKEMKRNEIKWTHSLSEQEWTRENCSFFFFILKIIKFNAPREGGESDGDTMDKKDFCEK